MAKSQLCCSRLDGQLVGKEALLRQLARRASHRQARGGPVAALLEEIAAAKVDIATTKQIIDEHAAEHAADDENQSHEAWAMASVYGDRALPSVDISDRWYQR